MNRDRQAGSPHWRHLLLGVVPMLVGLAGLWAAGCLVQQRCYQDRDCVSGSCDEASGSCVDQECLLDEDCGGFPFECVDAACEIVCGAETLDCPEGMASICGAYCIDVWEASRQDASDVDGGVDHAMAVSQPGVIPWYSSDADAGVNQQIAAAACESAGKRLCSPQEWELVCATLDDTRYAYGDSYDPAICNGIDTYCDCDGDGEPDGDEVYPHCRDACDTAFHVMPTGSFPACTNDFGIFDINGNVWELVSSDDGINHYRGGAYNCSDSERLHSCSYDGAESGNFPSAKGFRCCADGGPGS